jgi:hypothetical protein
MARGSATHVTSLWVSVHALGTGNRPAGVRQVPVAPLALDPVDMYSHQPYSVLLYMVPSAASDVCCVTGGLPDMSWVPLHLLVHTPHMQR